MMFCQQCGKQNDPDALFCVHCSHPLSSSCSACGTLNSPDARFCKKCGKPLRSGSERVTDLQQLRESAPSALKQKLQQATQDIEGQRKPVTILFTDIVGSTAIAEKLDPELWKEIVQGAHQRVSAAIHHYEGTVAQLLGDGVLAFFGAPITHEDDPIRAVRAAMDIQDSVKAYALELSNVVDNFQMRIGINTGTVAIGDVGTDMHVEYLAVGDAMNVAARLQSAARPGKVVVSKPCARLISALFDLKDLGEIKVKGKIEALHAFELISLKAEPEPRRGIEGLPSPYVGRAQEVEKLQSTLLALCDGHGQIVIVMGDAGIGKTRLLEEVKTATYEAEGETKAALVSPSSIRWLEGRAPSYGGSLSYWIITQLLLDDLGLFDGTSQVEIIVALRRRAKELFGEEKADEVLPYLAHLLGLKGEVGAEEFIQSFDGETLKKRTLKSVRDYFCQAAKEGPTVLVLEDMHWSDPSSLEALEGLLPLTDHVPLMILMLMRIDRDHGSWGVKLKTETDFPHRTTEIHLHRLSQDDSSSLIEQLLGETNLPEDVQRTIMERSEGNPLYLEEVVRHLLEQALIVQDDDGWRATEALREMSIPDTLQGVLLARIDRLEEDVRRTLQLASVIGKSFLYRILETISEAETQLDAHLSQLQRVDLVREKARIPELEYIFKHALTQEAAYSTLLHERRKDFHRKVGYALEKLFPDRVDEFSGLMAYHFEIAEALEKAADYLQRAGDYARLSFAHQEAIDFYERALVILRKQKTYDRAARTLMKLGLTYHTAFDYKRSRRAYDEAFTLRQRDRSTISKSLEPAPHPFRLVNLEPPTLDPSIYSDTTSLSYIIKIFSGLVEIGKGWDIRPDVARRWEISEDGRRYVFHLRDDVTWSDGTQVTAEDFVCSALRTLNPTIEGSVNLARVFYNITGAQAYHKGETSNSDLVGVRALNKLTLEVELERAASYFLNMLVNFYPVPSHIVEAYGEAWTEPEHIVSNGPFRLDSYEPAERICFIRNPSYHGEFLGNLEKTEVKLSDSLDSIEVFKLYKRDLVDIAVLGLDTFNFRHRFAEEYVTVPGPTLYYLVFDVMRPPFDDLNVRRAFVMALDRERMANEVLEGLVYPATGGFIPPNMPGHSPEIGLPYDPTRARQLLDQAGYPEGRDFPAISLLSPRTGKDVEYVSSQWLENLNVDISIQVRRVPAFFQEKFDTHLHIIGWSPDYPDPDNFIRVGIRSQLPHWKDDRYDQLLENAQQTLVQAERIRLYQQADELLMKDAIVMPIFYSNIHLLCKPWVKLPSGRKDLWTSNKELIIDLH
jgi:ABC-type oligopeptide transport system substrate-binding subunit/class 3 adenylate cyclase